VGYTRFLRTREEIAFRLRQEFANVALLVRPPRLDSAVLGAIHSPLPGLPGPAAIAKAARGTAYADDLLAAARGIREGRIPLLGLMFEERGPIAWRRDFLCGKETPAVYFRRIPYLDATVAGDHKVIWELNRHQYLVTLAQAWCLAPGRGYLDVIEAHLASWFEQNPFQRGINWNSALEVAFRALSWIWIFHLAGTELAATTRRALLEGLFRHGCHLEYNLSRYFSPNTHLLGEAVALHALGALFPQFPGAERWRRLGDRIVAAEAGRQIRADGSHFEQSTYYHVYALDMFLFHAVLSGEAGTRLREPIVRMGEYLDAIADAQGAIPFLGDDDGGRFFSPLGEHRRYAAGSLAAAARWTGRAEWIRSPGDAWPLAAWWFGPRAAEPSRGTPRASRLFKDSGIAVLRADDAIALADAGPFGPGNAGHSHSDTLSIVISSGEERILADPATYIYVGDARERDRFRGSAAHNTVRIAGRDQAEPAGPFRWMSKPRVEIVEWRSSAEADWLHALCAYHGCTHRRRILFLKPALWLVVDDVEADTTRAMIEQFWHPGEPTRAEDAHTFRIGTRARLTLTAPAALTEGGEWGWLSGALGRKRPAPVIRASLEGALPCRLGAAIDLDPPERPEPLIADSHVLRYGNREMTL
jgi:hypothetical protein